MNYNKIIQLLDSGLKPDEVVMTLMKSAPTMAKKIQKFIMGGWGTSEILSFLIKDKESQNFDFKNAKPYDPSEMAAMMLAKGKNSVAPSRDQEALQELQGFTKQAAQYALPYGASKLAQYALGRALPQAAQQLAPQLLNQGISPSPATATPQPASNISPVTPNINSEQLLSKSGLKTFIDRALQLNKPEDAAEATRKFYGKEVKALEKEAGVPFEEIINRYQPESEKPQETKIEPIKKPIEPQANDQLTSPKKEEPIQKETKIIDFSGMGKGITDNFYEGILESLKKGKNTFAGVKDTLISKAKPFFDKGLIKSTEDLKRFANEGEKAFENSKETESPTLGNLALLPKGEIGTIESVKNGIAKINTEEGIRHKKLDDLEALPISNPDLADLYAQLTNAIPENLRSSVINYAGYDSNANELVFRPHGGALYTYSNIPPEFADKLKNAMFKAKTTGDNFYGAWKSGEESRFAGLGQLIRDLQKQFGGKGKEYIRKYETIVDFLGAPEAAKKEKAKSLAEQRKKERDEKRKRKNKI